MGPTRTSRQVPRAAARPAERIAASRSAASEPRDHLQHRLGNLGVGSLLTSRTAAAVDRVRAFPDRDQEFVQNLNANDHAQVIDLHNERLAFVHYSYNVVQVGAQQFRDNEHLTLENALPALLATLAHVPHMTSVFLDQKHSPEAQKSTFKSTLNRLDYPGLDNLNFRPAFAVQGHRPHLGPVDHEAELRPRNGFSEPVAVDAAISLAFVAQLIEFVIDRLRQQGRLEDTDVDPAVLLGSIQAMAGRMGRGLGELFLVASQAPQFLDLALTVRKVVAGLREPRPGDALPDRQLLAGLTERKPTVRCNDRTRPFLERPAIAHEIGQFGLDVKQDWEVLEGQPQFSRLRGVILAECRLLAELQQAVRR